MEKGICLLLGFTILAGAAAAGTLYVAETGDDGNDGSTWPLAKRSIQSAVDAAGNGDVILVSNGTYTAAVDPVVSITKSVDIRGGNGPGETIIDGENARRCVYVYPTTAGDPVYMSGFTIRNGSSADSGAGVYKGSYRDLYISNCVIHANTSSTGGGGISKSSDFSQMLLFNCIISNNTAAGGYGGGAFSAYGRLNMFDCEIVHNTSRDGGGAIYGSSKVENPGIIFALYGCRMEHNTASGGAGGGVYYYGDDGGTGIIANCTMAYNQSSGSGGGIYHRTGGGYLCISNCMIQGNESLLNSAYAGGGLRINGDGAITGCLIVGNRAMAASGGAGGLLLETAARYFVENTTIASNSASLYAGGLMVNANVTTNMVVRNTIVYGNDASSSGRSNIWLMAGTGVILTNCCVAPLQNGSDQPVTPDAGNRTDDPLFAGMETGNFRLQRNSPYINAGANMPWMADAVDLDGHRRIDRFSGLVDLGCYEYVLEGTIFSLK